MPLLDLSSLMAGPPLACVGPAGMFEQFLVFSRGPRSMTL